MTLLSRIIPLIATYPDFRAALFVSPEAASSTWSPSLDTDKAAVLAELHYLIAAPPQDLAALLASSGLMHWGDVSLVLTLGT